MSAAYLLCSTGLYPPQDASELQETLDALDLGLTSLGKSLGIIGDSMALLQKIHDAGSKLKVSASM